MKQPNDKPCPITDRIKSLMERLDMKPFHLSQKTGIDNAVIYKLR